MNEFKTDRFNFYFVGALLLIGFNVWHTTTRPLWPGSIRKSLTIGEPVIALAKTVDPKIEISRPYDGQFVYAISLDPLILTRASISSIDLPTYRYRRMLLPFLAWVLSLGHLPIIPYFLFVLNLAAWIAIGMAGAQIAKIEKINAAVVVLGLVTIAGLSFSAVRSLTEPMSVAFTLWACVWYRKNNFLPMIVCFALAMLARERAVVAALVVCAYGIYERKYSLVRGLLMFAAICGPLALWMLYVKWRIPADSYPYASRMTLPGIGFWRETVWAGTYNTTKTELVRSLSINIVFILMTVFASVFFWRRRNVWGALALCELIFCSMLQGGLWNNWVDSSRMVLPPTAFFLVWLFTIKSVSAAPGRST